MCIILLVSRKNKRNGVLLSMYFIGYGIGRFIIEALRTDSLYIVPGIRASQVFSLLLIAIGIVLLLLIRNGVLKIPQYEGKYLLNKNEGV